jgi:hypothetical protein
LDLEPCPATRSANGRITWTKPRGASAVRGEYFETGALLEKRRRKDVRMNTEVRNVDERKLKPGKRKRP